MDVHRVLQTLDYIPTNLFRIVKPLQAGSVEMYFNSLQYTKKCLWAHGQTSFGAKKVPLSATLDNWTSQWSPPLWLGMHGVFIDKVNKYMTCFDDVKSKGHITSHDKSTCYINGLYMFDVFPTYSTSTLYRLYFDSLVRMVYLHHIAMCFYQLQLR